MENIIKPIPLKKGDLIGVYSPSSAIGDELMPNYQRGKKLLIKRGYEILESKHIFDKKAHYSSDAKDKVDDFMGLLMNPEVKAILPSIGGTTAYQMLPLLDFKLISSLLLDTRKMVFGFSDNSLQTSTLSNICNYITFHGHSDVVFGLGDLENKDVMESFITKGKYTKKFFFDTLEGKYETGIVKKITEWKVLKSGKANGKLMGGNIDVLQILHGTPYSINWRDKIFYWEVCHLDLHRVDLILASFALTGVLSQIKGMVIGKSNTLKETFYTKYESFEEMIIRHCEPYDFPIVYDADFGHDVECCMLPNGIQAEIEDNNLKIKESPYTY